MNTQQPTEIPYGYCQCGCGEKTRIATRNCSATGRVKGRPMRYVHGHSGGEPPKQLEWEVRDCGYTTACWVYIGSVSPEGYGRLNTRYAHRVAYERYVGAIPTGLHLDHLCRNRRCCNPEHLEPVTQAENVRRGANARLTFEVAELIRCAEGTTREIGRRFGIDHGRVSRIKRGLLWSS